MVPQSSRERQESSTERVFKVSRGGSSLCNVGLQRTKNRASSEVHACRGRIKTVG